MAQNLRLAAAQSAQAQSALERYVYGTPLSTIPPPVPRAAVFFNSGGVPGS